MVSESEIQFSVIRELAGNLPNSRGRGHLGRRHPSRAGINALHNAQNQMDLPGIHIHSRLRSGGARAKGLQETEEAVV